MIDSNNNKPKFGETSYSATITENTDAGDVLTVAATDSDRGNNAKIAYSIVTDDQNLPFKVDASSGVLACTAKFDYEAMSAHKFEFKVKAKDDGDTPQESEVPVTITVTDLNDNKPIFDPTSGYAKDVVFESAKVGDVLVTVKVSDKDSGDNKKLTLVVLGPDHKTSDYFELDSSNQVKIKKVPPFAGESVISAYVRATDGGAPALVAIAPLTFKVIDSNNNKPKFGKTSYAATVQENIGARLLVTVSATDGDVGRNAEIEYSIASGNKNLPFTIDSKSGAISSTRKFNHEESDDRIFKFSAVATDKGKNPQNGTAEVVITITDANDEIPTFDSKTQNLVAKVNRNLALKSKIAKFVAADLDADNNGKISFTILHEFTNDFEISTKDFLFEMDETSGEITLIKALCSDGLKDITRVVITVQAADNGSPKAHKSISSLTVIINEVNEAAPKFSSDKYEEAIPFSTPEGSPVVKVVATDAEKCIGGNSITYKITSATDKNLFSVDAKSGTIKLEKSITSSTASVQKLTVLADDGGKPDAKTANVTVEITISTQFYGLFTQTGTGFLNTAVKLENKHGISQNFGFFRNGAPDSTGKVTALWGHLTQSGAYAVARKPATKVRAVVMQQNLWGTNPTARFVLQAADADGSNEVAAAELTITLTPEVALRNVKDVILTKTCTLPANTKHGVCFIGVALPPVYFQSSAKLKEGQPYKVKAEYAIKGQQTVKIADLTINRRSAVESKVFKSDVVLEVPPADFFAGQFFEASVWARGTFDITVFTVKIISDGNIAFRLPLVFDSKRWSLVASKSGNTLVVAGSVLTSAKISDKETTAEELLFKIPCTVNANVKPSTVKMELKIETLTQHKLGRIDVRGVKRKDGEDAPSGSYLDRTGGHTDDKGAQVWVVADAVVALLTYVPLIKLLNTAKLDGKKVAYSIGAFVCNTCPRSKPSLVCTTTCAGVKTKCTSADDKALQVDGSCNVFLDGSETKPAKSVNVKVEGGGKAETVAFQVWYPTIPVTVRVESNSVYPIKDWIGGNDCKAQLYTRTRISVFASFAVDGSGSGVQTVVVTELLRKQLVSSDKKVAVVDNTAVLPFATGVAEGVSNVQVVLGGNVLGQQKVLVAKNPLNVARIEVTLASGLAITNPAAGKAASAQPYDRDSLQKAAAVLLTKFDVEGTRVEVIASAILENSARITVSPAMGLNLVTSDTKVAAVSKNGESYSLGSTAGKVTLTSNWINPKCTKKALGTGKADLTVKLEDPLEIQIQLSATKVSPAKNDALLLGLAPSADVQVFLVFPNNVKRDYTLDKRLSFDLTGVNSLFEIETTKDGSKKPKLVPATKPGVGKFKVKFSHLDSKLVASLKGNEASATVVTAKSATLTASPYPVYDGSRSFREVILSKYKGTSSTTRQQSRLHFKAELSDGSSFQVDSSNHVKYVVYEKGTAKQTSLLKEARVASDRVLSVAGTPDGLSGTLVDIEGTFGSSLKTRLTVQVTDTVLPATKLYFVKLVSTLRGILGSAKTNVHVAGQFEDGTTHPFVVKDGKATLPGLVKFKVAEANSASVDGNGVLQLKANLPVSNALTASCVGKSSDVKVSSDFACNVDPDKTDVDLGSATGIAVGPVKAKSTFTVDLSVNSNGQAIGPFEFLITYDKDIFEPVSVAAGADLQSGGGAKSLLAQINDPPGKLKIAGIPNKDNLKGARYTLCTITFKALDKTGQTTLKGVVAKLVEPDVSSGQKNIGKPGRAFAAGNLVVVVAKSRLQRSTAPDDLVAATRASSWPRRGVRQEHPVVRVRRAACEKDISGDANGDCEFDVVDSAYTSQYVVEKLVNFKGTFGDAFKRQPPSKLQLKHLDSDLSGSIDNIDAFYLARANVKMTRFVEDLKFTAIDNSDGANKCVLKLQTTVLIKESTPDGSASGKEQTLVYFVLGSKDKKFSAVVADSVDDCDKVCAGKFVKNSGHDTKNVFGAVIAAQQDAKDKSQFHAAFRTDLYTDEIGEVGLSLLIVTRDATLKTSNLRQVFLSQYKSSATYGDKLTLKVPVGDDEATVIVNGYSPLTYVKNELGSSDCLNVHAPVFKQGAYFASVVEDVKVKSNLVKLEATDADKGTKAKLVQYEITDRNDDPAVFAIGASDGQISTTKNLSVAEYILTVQAKDSAPPFNKKTVQVQVVSRIAKYKADDYIAKIEFYEDADCKKAIGDSKKGQIEGDSGECLADKAADKSALLSCVDAKKDVVHVYVYNGVKCLANEKLPTFIPKVDDLSKGITVGKCMPIKATDPPLYVQADCHLITTPTTTRSTTPTSTQTTSLTSTLTSTGTTTLTSTVTTSLTTTMTTTMTTTPGECPQGTVEIAKPSKTSARICKNAFANFTSFIHLYATLTSAAGQGAVKIRLKSVGKGKFQTQGLLATGSRDAVFSVHCKGVGAVLSGKLAHQRSPAVHVEGILHDKKKYHDQPKIGVSFQVRNAETYSTNTAAVNVEVRISATSTKNLAAGTVKIRCGGKPPGICHAKIEPKPADDGGFYDKLKDKEELLVEYKVEKADKFGSLGKIVVHKPPAAVIAAHINTVYSVAPSRALYPGEVFDMEIRSRFKWYLKTVEVQVVVGGSIELVYDKNFPAVAKQNNGASVFAQAAIDGDANKVYAVLAGRKDGRKPEAQESSGITNELLFTLRVKVKSNAKINSVGTLQITKLEGVTNLKETALKPKITGVIVSRDGPVCCKDAAKVYITTNIIVGMFAYADGATEIVNTAVIDGKAITTPIKSVLMYRQGEQASGTSGCVPLQAKTMVVAKCVVSVDKTKQGAAKEATVRVTSEAGGYVRNVPFRIHALVAGSVAIKASRESLRPIVGWFQEDCKTMQYQHSFISATATFGDGSGYTFENYDITAIAKFSTSDAKIAKVTKDVSGVVANGVGAGKTTIHVVDIADKSMNSVGITVLGQDPDNAIVLTNLDLVVLASMGTVSLTGKTPYGRDSTLNITVGPPNTKKLQYKGDSTFVVASAVFNDDSRLELTAANGLVVSSNNKKAAVVSGQKITVPFDPQAFKGKLITVTWKPKDKCSNLPDAATKDLELEVAPPQAESMTASTSQAFVVCSDDVATKTGAEFPNTAQLTVGLKFPKGVTKKNLQGDNRTTYTVLTEGLITVDQKGKVTANNKATVGTAKVLIRFQGQTVTKEIVILVAKYTSLEVLASPFPIYAKSEAVDASTISKIACTTPTKYQQALLRVVMHLSNKVTKSIAKAHTTFKITTVKGALKTLTAEDRICTGHAEGTVRVAADFAKGAATSVNPLKITVTNTAVRVSKITSFVLRKQGAVVTTLSGKKGVQQAQLGLGAVFSDDRQYDVMFRPDGTPVLPGVVTFASKVAAKASVHETKGTVLLRDNHLTAVTLEAESCAKSKVTSAKKGLGIFCNLHPVEVGDADVGRTAGAPLPDTKVGQNFPVRVRVNTNQKKLSFFNVKLKFDPKAVKLIEAKHTISNSQGQVNFKVGLSDEGDEVVAVGTISKSSVASGTAGVDVFEATFQGVAEGVTKFTGTVVQLLDSTQGSPQRIGKPNQAFEAGVVDMKVIGKRRRRSDDIADGVVLERHRRADENPIELGKLPVANGDANCDGLFDGKDPVFILNYIAAKGNSFSTQLGKIMKGKAEACRSKLKLKANADTFMDADQNTEVTTLDITFLLDVLAGNFYFMHVHVRSATAKTCASIFTVTLANALGKPPRNGTRVLLDMSHLDKQAKLTAALDKKRTAGLVQLKGNTSTLGALVKVEPLKGNAGRFTFEMSRVYPKRNLAALVKVGLSVIQVASRPVLSGTRYKFFGGAASAKQSKKFKAKLEFSAELLGTKLPLELPNGFNPLLHDVSTDAPDVCFVDTTTATTTQTSTGTTTPTAETSTATTSPTTTATTTHNGTKPNFWLKRTTTAPVTTTMTSNATTTAVLLLPNSTTLHPNTITPTSSNMSNTTTELVVFTRPTLPIANPFQIAQNETAASNVTSTTAGAVLQKNTTTPVVLVEKPAPEEDDPPDLALIIGASAGGCCCWWLLLLLLLLLCRRSKGDKEELHAGEMTMSPYEGDVELSNLARSSLPGETINSPKGVCVCFGFRLPCWYEFQFKPCPGFAQLPCVVSKVDVIFNVDMHMVR